MAHFMVLQNYIEGYMLRSDSQKYIRVLTLARLVGGHYNAHIQTSGPDFESNVTSMTSIVSRKTSRGRSGYEMSLTIVLRL